MKNLRNKAIERGLLNAGEAPSYFVEGLLYNVPDNIFMTDLRSCFVELWNWVGNCKKEELLCANERFYLLNELSLVTWRRPLLDKLLAATSELWNNW